MRKNTFTFEYGDPRCHASFVGIDCGEVRTSFSIHRYLAGVYADRFDESCLILNTKTGEFVKRVEPGILASNPQTAPRLNRHPSAEELIRTLNAISRNNCYIAENR